ncbi:unnamed protein product [Sphenostylis stenocarpa]|uniref:TF-B3 domain-containing protein n=1 Tax=Sphenostylis stenocarpa TaxID=92480 RepID=A0AA86VVU9_9FABA|nr:unnamed protein product [Sphenostylis stenocarpa]
MGGKGQGVSYIPPAFSSIVANLVDKKINLNDSSGQQWKVKVSEVNGSFVFGMGWNVFSLSHGLKVGYLLVFNYIKGFHFDVKIYDTSACEKLGFPVRRNQKKRSRGTSDTPVRDGVLVRHEPNALVVSKLHAPKMKRQCSEVEIVAPQKAEESGPLMQIPDHCEDPCYSISPEFDQSHADDGTMKIENGDLKVSNVDYRSNIFENDATTSGKDTMIEGIFSTEAALDISELEIAGRSTSRDEADTSTYDKTSNLKIEENKENKAITSNRKAKGCQFSEGLGEMSRMLKKELVTFNEMETKGSPKETNEQLESDIFNEDNESGFKTTHLLSCVVPHDDVCLKLPKCLPGFRKLKVGQHRNMVVFLRDPVRRLWPVFYHEKTHLRLLTHGWLDFSRANNIQPRDECIFEAEVDPEGKSKHTLSEGIRFNLEEEIGV